MKVTGLIVLICLFINGNVNAQPPIKIGVITAFADSVSKQSINAMNLAIKQVNDNGGLLGRKVELVIADDEMKPEKAVAAIDRLVTVDKVDIITGGYGSATTMAMIPSMKKYQKVVIWTGGVSSKVEEAMQGQDFFFHTMNWDYSLASLWNKSWNDMAEKYNFKRQRIFIMYEEGAFGTGSFKAQKEINDKLGRETIGVPFKSAATHGEGNYRAQLRQAKEFKPDEFFLICIDKDVLPIMEQAKEMNFTPIHFIGLVSFVPTDTGKSSLINGLIRISLWTNRLADTNKESRDFLNEYKKEYGNDIPTIVWPAGYYTNVMLAVEGIKKANSLDTVKIIRALESIKYKSPIGKTIAFGKSKFINHQSDNNVFILQWQNGKEEIIYPLENATANLIYPFKREVMK